MDLYLARLGEKDIGDTMKEIEGNGEQILIVEDEGVLRAMAGEMLQKLGYSVTAVASGEEAVSYLEENQAHLVMLDMLLGPGINGRELYERILSFRPGQRAIIVSGFADSREINRTLQMGASQLVKKPYSLNELGLAVKKALLG
ncbi:MAG: response regulator [Desulfocapsaceae bacterium]|nr:response regulator [Desulfocapsaceae bacterium]